MHISKLIDHLEHVKQEYGEVWVGSYSVTLSGEKPNIVFGSYVTVVPMKYMQGKPAAETVCDTVWWPHAPEEEV